MKKTAVFAFVLIMIIAAAALIATAADVVITPSSPTNSNDLVCHASGLSGDADFYWFKNGQEYKMEFGTQSTVPASETNSGETWKCEVFTPLGSKIGESEVKIDSQPTGNVVITPEKPHDNDSLRCFVAGLTADADFYWFKNGNEFKNDIGTESTVNAADTSSGDTWKCEVFTPLGSKIGEASVGIDTGALGSVIIEPANPYTNDNLKGYVGGTSAPFDFYWTKNGADFKEDSGTQTVIDAKDTKKHDIWVLKAYTPLYNSLIGEASVEILNSLPAITSISAPSEVREGDNVDVSFSATDADNDTISYKIYRNGILIANSNSNSWATRAGDSGTYTYTFAANDGEAETITSATVVVKGIGEGGTQLRLLKDLEIISYKNYLKIRNEGTTLNDLEIKINYLNINGAESFKFDKLSKNEIKFEKLATAGLDENRTYLARIELEANGVEDSGYLLIKK